MPFDPSKKKKELRPEDAQFLCAKVDEEMDRLIQEAWEREFEDPDFCAWYEKFGGRSE